MALTQQEFQQNINNAKQAVFNPNNPNESSINQGEAAQIFQQAQQLGLTPAQISQMIGDPNINESVVSNYIATNFPNDGANYMAQNNIAPITQPGSLFNISPPGPTTGGTYTPPQTSTTPQASTNQVLGRPGLTSSQPPPSTPTATTTSMGGPAATVTGNAGGYISTQQPGGLSPNNDFDRYPTKIPQSPNYEGAANQQGAANLDAARSTIALSNPNQITPFGSQTYTIGPDGRPVQNQNLSPEQQKRYDDLNSILPSVTRNIREQTGRNIGEYDFSKVMDPNSVALSDRKTSTGVQGQSAVAEALRAREQPRLDKKRQQLESQLLARGFNPGTEGWNEAIDDFSRAENDFNLGLVGISGQEQSRLFDLDSSLRSQEMGEFNSRFNNQTSNRGREINEQVLARQLPIQEYGQLVQAMTPQLPQFNGYTGATVDANPILNATTQQGLFDLGRYGTSVQGELGTRGINAGSSDSDKQAAASLAAAAAMFFSDTRLKHGIRKIGELINGISLYAWKWTRKGKMLAGDQPAFGVLAQEVLRLIPAAVSVKGGYYQVDYSQVLAWHTNQPQN